MTWDLLAILASNEGVDLRRFLQRACQHWGRGGRLKVTLMSYLQTHVGTQNNHVSYQSLIKNYITSLRTMSSAFVIYLE